MTAVDSSRFPATSRNSLNDRVLGRCRSIAALDAAANLSLQRLELAFANSIESCPESCRLPRVTDYISFSALYSYSEFLFSS